jgi:hypothetical protein
VRRPARQMCSVPIPAPKPHKSGQSVRYSWDVRQPHKIGPSQRGRPSRAAVYERLRVQIGELRERLGGLPTPLVAEGIWRGIWLEEAHHSTAIEGNTLVLKQVEAFLAEGRAVGEKELSEYLEVRGYATAADWVSGHGLQPGAWSDGDPISLAEVRHIHALAMTPAWDVAPHPHARERDGPGSFREHDIEPFPGGMEPPPWTEVPDLMRDWVNDAAALRHEGGGLDRRGFRRPSRSLRADAPVPGRQRASGAPYPEPPLRPAWHSAGGHLQGGPSSVPQRDSPGRPRRSRPAGRVPCASGARQSLQVRRSSDRRSGPDGAIARARDSRAVGECASSVARPAEPHVAGWRWPRVSGLRARRSRPR